MRKEVVLKRSRASFLFLILLLFFSFISPNVFSSSFEWWNSSWHYRIPVEINASSYDRENSPIELNVNFTKELSSFNSGSFDNNSVRVIEYNSSGTILYETASQFEESQGYSSANSVGTVVWIMNGTTPANEKRYYMIYFDSVDHPKNAPNYVSGINYSWDGENISINNSILKLKIDTDRKNVSGLYYAKRYNTTIFDRPATEYPIEYLKYYNGSDLGFDLRDNASFTTGPVKLTITQVGPETLFGNPSVKTNEGNITKKYIIYKDNPWIKIEQIFYNTGSGSITRGTTGAGPLTLDAQRAFGIDYLYPSSSSDPYSWKSAYSSSGPGLGVINTNESGTSNFSATGDLNSGYIGIELANTTIIPAGSSIAESAAVLFNNETSHTPVEDLKNRLQNPVIIETNSTENYTVVAETRTNHAIYNRGENVVVTANISQDTHNLTAYVNATFDMGTSNSSDDVTIVLYDDGTHGDQFANDGVYTDNYTIPDSSYIGLWNVTSKIYDSSYYLLYQSSASFNITNVYYVELNITNPDGVINRTIYGNISVMNYRNDSGISGAEPNCSYNGTSVSNYYDYGNGNYSFNFTAPSSPGNYTLICSPVRFNNTGSDSGTFRTQNPTATVSILMLPENLSIENITQDQSQNFTINVTLNNTGQSTVFDSNITLNLPQNWSSNPVYYECGNISIGDSCFTEFNITIPSKYGPGNYNITSRVNWTNLNGSTNSTQDSSVITVISNPILNVIENNINGVVSEGTSLIVGNLTLNSTGNDVVNVINFSCVSGTVCSNFTVTFNPSYLSNLSAGSSYSVSVNVSVPEGFNPGNYSGVLNITSQNGGYKIIPINISVPESGSWTISSQNCSEYVLVNQTGSMCNITIFNIGNTQINFTISPGQANYTSINTTSLNIAKQSSATFEILYNATGADRGTYNSTYVVNSTGTPSQRNVTSSLIVVLGPTVHSLTENNSEQTGSIEIKAEVIDLSNHGINYVNATIIQPNGFIDYVNLTNITANVPGGTSYWAYNYTNTSQRGTYNVTIRALDNGNGPGSVSDSFKVYALLIPHLSTTWNNYFAGEIATINYNLSDYNNVPLNGNVSLQVLKDSLVLMNESHTTSNGIIDVVPTFQIASDSESGNYTLKAITHYYDPLAGIVTNKTSFYYFQVHKPLQADIETSVVWYPDNIMKFYILVYGTGNISSELSNTSIELMVYDPAENLFFSVTKANLSVFSQSEDSVIYKYNYALPTTVATGLYLATLTLTQGDRNTMKLKSFRVSSGGPYDLVIDSISSEVPQGQYLNFTIRVENKGEVSQDVTLDYWISDAQGTIYNSVNGEAVYVAANSNRSFDRELFVGSSQSLGTYYLNVRMTYSQLQPYIETNRTFQVIKAVEKNVTTNVTQVITPSGGGGIQNVAAVEEPVYSIEITKLYPDKMLIERGGVRYLIVKVKNTGNQDLSDLTAYIDGIPSSWAVPAELSQLSKGKTSTFLIKLNVPQNEKPREIKTFVKVVSDKVSAKKEFSIQVFQSKEELIKAVIDNTKNSLKELELKAAQIGQEYNITKVVENMEQANDLIQLSEKNLDDGNLIKAMNFIEEAKNTIERGNYLLASGRKEKVVVYKFPFVQTATAVGGLLAFALVGVLLILLVHGNYSRSKEISSIKKVITPTIRVERGIKQKAINKEKVKTFIELKKSEIEDLMDTLQTQFQRGLISAQTYEELKKKYEKDMLHIEEKTCKECGYINDADAAFCIRCGAKL